MDPLESGVCPLILGIAATKGASIGAVAKVEARTASADFAASAAERDLEVGMDWAAPCFPILSAFFS